MGTGVRGLRVHLFVGALCFKEKEDRMEGFSPVGVPLSERSAALSHELVAGQVFQR